MSSLRRLHSSFLFNRRRRSIPPLNLHTFVFTLVRADFVLLSPSPGSPHFSQYILVYVVGTQACLVASAGGNKLPFKKKKKSRQNSVVTDGVRTLLRVALHRIIGARIPRSL